MKTQHTHTNTWYDSRLVTNEKVKKKTYTYIYKKKGEKYKAAAATTTTRTSFYWWWQVFLTPFGPTQPLPLSHTHTHH